MVIAFETINCPTPVALALFQPKMFVILSHIFRFVNFHLKIKLFTYYFHISFMKVSASKCDHPYMCINTCKWVQTAQAVSVDYQSFLVIQSYGTSVFKSEVICYCGYHNIERDYYWSNMGSCLIFLLITSEDVHYGGHCFGAIVKVSGVLRDKAGLRPTSNHFMKIAKCQAYLRSGPPRTLLRWDPHRVINDQKMNSLCIAWSVKLNCMLGFSV